MKKLSVLVSFLTIVLVLSHVSFSQSLTVGEDELTTSELSIHAIAAAANADCPNPPLGPQTLPFGYPPYPTNADAYPAFGAPYSYPRASRRAARAARLAPPQFQPLPLPPPAAAFTPNMPAPPMVAPPMVAPPMVAPPAVPPMAMGQFAPAPPFPPGQPTVFYRPTPIRNFMSLLTAPRPYIGFDPYAGYPPFPGYIPPQ